MGLRGRLLLAFLIPTLLVLSLGGFGLYRASRNVLEDELGKSLAGIAATVSSQLKGEHVLALEAADAQGEGSRTWRTLTAEVRSAGRSPRLLDSWWLLDVRRRSTLAS